MKIRIICVGKLKEAFYRDACAEYRKRLTRYAEVDIEGERILKHIRPQDHCIALAIDGKRRTSEAFAKELGDAMTGGISSVAFVIGGSLGLGEKVLARADRKLSFSDFTFPHQLMRVILLEQVYRAFRILKNEPYHK